MDLIVIDDDKFMKKVFDMILKDQGLNYCVYTNPHEGIVAVENDSPCCVVVDYIMPDLRGDELIIKASQKLLFKKSNFIMITGEAVDEMARMKFMTLGFQYVFAKSDIKSPIFLETIKELIADKKAA
ncbi:response regulator [Bacteriovorax sp. Seq25_V]|uniref:response regulator n=1 Tax=Bacteriovorax sp. Seq25_V TaxID=1201288 RepID=UPI00038A06AA|nr:response regulator [Bacteriovorax sp. Seq25_V]EQC47717.1 response regulator receiver domain protein [Bacteriovorax sp. Seq25_V]